MPGVQEKMVVLLQGLFNTYYLAITFYMQLILNLQLTEKEVSVSVTVDVQSIGTIKATI